MFNCRLQNKDNLSTQIVLLLKNIWLCKNVTTLIVPDNLEKYNKLTFEEINLQICNLETKTKYIQVPYIVS